LSSVIRLISGQSNVTVGVLSYFVLLNMSATRRKKCALYSGRTPYSARIKFLDIFSFHLAFGFSIIYIYISSGLFSYLNRI
jgi:hypothetical protein